MTYLKSYRIIDGKPRWVIVDENGTILNRNPGKKELRGLENEPYVVYYNQPKKYTDEELLGYLKNFVEINGRAPVRRDFNNNSIYPNVATYQRRFGSWNKALEKVLDKFQDGRHGHKSYTNEELLNELRRFEKENGRSPIMEDLNNNSKYPSKGIYQDRFGSWQNALKLVGLDVDTMVKNGIIENEYQKGRFAEIIVRDHFKHHPIDLAGENKTSPYDGICPNGLIYEVKSSKLHKNTYYLFNTRNKYKEEIEIYYFLAFNDDYTKLEYAWIVPGELVENDNFSVGSSSYAEFNVENMNQYDITERLKLSIDKIENN